MQAILSKINVPNETSSETKPNLKITWKYLLAWFALTLVSGELHEQVHIQIGRIVCGGYGARDFNVWSVAADCAEPSLIFLATLAGPLWSYTLMWTGAFLLCKAKSANFKSLGFALVFAPLPFARIFSAIMGGGDEKVVLQKLLSGALDIGAIKILAAGVVTVICLPPILIAFRQIGNRFRLFYVVGFSVVPLVVLSLYVFGLLNSLLASGFLSSPVSGTPLLVVIHFSLAAVLFAFSCRWLLEIKPETKS